MTEQQATDSDVPTEEADDEGSEVAGPPEGRVETCCSQRTALDEDADLKIWHYTDGSERVWAEISGAVPDIILGECASVAEAEARAESQYEAA